jgi:hypothetical protein
VAVRRIGPAQAADGTVARHMPWEAFLILPLKPAAISAILPLSTPIRAARALDFSGQRTIGDSFLPSLYNSLARMFNRRQFLLYLYNLLTSVYVNCGTLQRVEALNGGENHRSTVPATTGAPSGGVALWGQRNIHDRRHECGATT